MTMVKPVTHSRVAGPAAVSVGHFGYIYMDVMYAVFALEKVTRTSAQRCETLLKSA